MVEEVGRLAAPGGPPEVWIIRLTPARRERLHAE
jgi:hypothetical protein